MQRIIPLVFLTLVACEQNETWVYGPTAQATAVLQEGQIDVTGTAVLTYDPSELPAAAEIASNALRLSVSSSNSEDVVAIDLDHPDTFRAGEGTADAMNADGIFTPCPEAMCEVRVDFTVTRAGEAAGTLEVSGDAIVSFESGQHITDPQSDSADLEILLD